MIRGIDMARDSEWIRLEEYVEKLLGEFSSVKAERQRLEKLLREQQAENKRLTEALNSVDSERTDVCDRVTSIISRLERWEADLDNDPPVPEPRLDVVAESGAEPSEFNEDTDQDENDRSGVQGSLFSG